MLDNSITLFNVSLEDSMNPISDNRLVLSSCKAIVTDSTYSEFDELSFANVNHNDYGFGYIEYEFSFIEKFKNPYMKFYISCFSFRMNTLGYSIKENCPRPNKKLKFLMPDTYTKVNKIGNLSFGIRFYFRTLEERNAFLNCNELCIEGFVALGKKNNTYNLMCRLSQHNGKWDIADAYTYRRDGRMHIFSYWH